MVEALHLTDDIMEFVEISDKKFGNRRDETQTMLAGINAGNFPTEIDAVTCPRCPHFFICPAAPKGPLDAVLEKIALRLSGYPLVFPITW